MAFKFSEIATMDFGLGGFFAPAKRADGLRVSAAVARAEFLRNNLLERGQRRKCSLSLRFISGLLIFLNF
jgi:hypothetical protein